MLYSFESLNKKTCVPVDREQCWLAGRFLDQQRARGERRVMQSVRLRQVVVHDVVKSATHGPSQVAMVEVTTWLGQDLY